METDLSQPTRKQHSNHTKRSLHEKDTKCFFTIILPSTIREKQLLIPPNFVNVHGNELSDIVILKLEFGNGWPVRLKKDDDGNVWFENGWEEFVQYYSICAGDFLMFRYDGNSQFDVHIYDLNAGEVEYPGNLESLDKPNRDTTRDLVPYRKGEEGKDLIEEGEIFDVYEGSNLTNFTCTGKECVEDIVEEGEIVDGYEVKPPMLTYPKKLGVDSLEDGEINDGYEVNPPISQCSDKFHVDSTLEKRRGRVCENDTRYKSADISLRPRENARLNYETQFEVVPVGIGGQERNPLIPSCPDRLHCDSSVEKLSQTVCENETRCHKERRSGRPKDHETLENGNQVKVVPLNIGWQKSKPPNLPRSDKKLSAKSNLGKIRRWVSKNATRYKGTKIRKPRENVDLKYDNQIEVVPIEYDHEPITCLPIMSLPNPGKKKRERTDDQKELISDVQPLCTVYPATGAIESQDKHVVKQDRSTLAIEGQPNLRARVKRTISSRRNDTACQEANAFKSENPFFMVLMRPTYVSHKYVLNIPYPFMLKYIGTGNHNVVLVSNGKKWIARCHMYEDVLNAKLYSWGAFARENDLIEEDVCVFEMIDPREVVFKVHIFRN